MPRLPGGGYQAAEEDEDLRNNPPSDEGWASLEGKRKSQTSAKTLGKRKYKVEVTQTIEVELDESKFTDEFNKIYDEYFSYFGGDLEEHAKQLAWLTLVTSGNFYEGYGELSEMNIKTRELEGENRLEVIEMTKS
jgi:hypothetical protein